MLKNFLKSFALLFGLAGILALGLIYFKKPGPKIPPEPSGAKVSQAYLGHEIKGEVTVQAEELTLQGQFEHDSSAQSGNAKLKTILSGIPLSEVKIEGGQPLVNTLIRWHEGKLTQVDIEVVLSSLSGQYKQLAFENLNALASATTVPTTLLTKPITFSAERLLVSGIEFLELSGVVDYDFQAPTWQTAVRINSLKASVFGGRIILDKPSTLAQTLHLSVDGVAIERILELYPQDIIRASGLLDGSIPLKIIDGAVAIEGGRLLAREPGGTIQYLGSTAAGGPEFKIALEALSRFHYTLLSARADYSKEGKLVLDLTLHGRNNEWKGGQPVHLNVTIEEDIPALLKSIELTHGITGALEREVKDRMR